MRTWLYTFSSLGTLDETTMMLWFRVISLPTRVQTLNPVFMLTLCAGLLRTSIRGLANSYPVSIIPRRPLFDRPTICRPMFGAWTCRLCWHCLVIVRLCFVDRTLPIVMLVRPVRSTPCRTGLLRTRFSVPWLLAIQVRFVLTVWSMLDRLVGSLVSLVRFATLWLQSWLNRSTVSLACFDFTRFVTFMTLFCWMRNDMLLTIPWGRLGR